MDVGFPWRYLRIIAGQGVRATERAARRMGYRGRAGWRRQVRVRDVYHALASGHVRAAEHQLALLLDPRVKPVVILESVFALLVLAIVQAQRRRADNILAYLAAAYTLTDRDRALMRTQRRIRARWRDQPPPSAIAQTVLAADDWGSLIRRVSETLTATSAPRITTQLDKPTAALNAARTDRPPLVVVHMTGGLGNQLFQYAAGYRYASVIGGRLRLDLRAYAGSAFPFLLPQLTVPFAAASIGDIARATRRTHIEPRVSLDPVVLNPAKGLWMHGYWEDPVYFAGVEEQVRAWFQPADAEVVARARTITDAVRAEHGTVVGLHVRRGDRAGGPGAPTAFPMLPTVYYRAAASRFPPGTGFLVFSDTPADVEWCRGHLGLDACYPLHFAAAADPILDLFSLAACDHLIISASTFSWWAAWLNPRPGKVVITPDLRIGYGPRLAERDPRPPPLPGWQVVEVEPSVRCFPEARNRSGVACESRS